MTTQAKPGKIYALIPKVMEEIGAIGKTQTNKFDDYKFRGIDDLLKALHPALVKHGLFIVPHLDACEVKQTKTSGGKNTMAARVEITYTIYADDGSSVSGKAVGEGWERGDKAVAIATSTAMKIFCFQFFCIPTDACIDSEDESPQVGDPPAQPPKAAGPSNEPGTATSDQVGTIMDLAESKQLSLEPVFKWAEKRFADAGNPDAKMGQVADMSEAQAAETIANWTKKG